MKPPEGTRQARRFRGGRVVLAGLLIVLAITAFVVIRIVQTSEPGPAREEIPARPPVVTPP